jgi:hypothetical protein
MEDDKNISRTGGQNEKADAAQRQSPNQDIANDANNQAQANKVDSGSGTTARADASAEADTD